MRATLILILAVVTVSTISNGQTPTSAPAPPQPRFEDTLSKTVVRITAKVEGYDQPWNGTGFLVAVPDARSPIANGGFTYLVTNRHVAEAIHNDGDGPKPHRILTLEAVVNLKTPVNGTRAHSISLPTESGAWFFPDDKSIDIALVPIRIEDSYDVVDVTPAIFLTPDTWKQYRIGPGDKLLTCGYFVHYAGAHQFQPIIREGSLAMIPDDEMPVPIGGNAQVYLADIHIIPGNSGSPLFLAPAFTLGGYVSDGKGGIPYGILG